jgi:hypothetical protein
VEIIRPSEHQLIFKTPGNMREVINEFVAIAPFWMVITFIFVFILHVLQPETPLNITIPFTLAPYVSLFFISIVITHDNTAIFDLDLQSIKIERYWILIRKSQYQNYKLTNIENVIVEEDSEFYRFFIRLRQYSGEDIYISQLDSRDRSIVDRKAQEIRDFLGLSIDSIE